VEEKRHPAFEAVVGAPEMSRLARDIDAN